MIRSRPRRSSETRLLLSSLALLWLLLLGGGARAQEDPDPAQVKAYRAHVTRALEQWNAERYAEARAEYQKAYNIQPQPILLFNIASTYRKEENYEKAIGYYRRYLEVAPPDHEYRSQAEWAIDVIEDLLRKQQQQEQQQRDSQLAGQSQGGAPPSGAGHVDRNGSSRAYLYAGAATGTVGLAVLGYGLYEGQRARRRESFFEGLPSDYVWTEKDQKKYNEGQLYERRAIIFSIVGGVALITGSALLVVALRDEPQEEKDSLTVAPFAGDSGAGVSLLGSF